MNQQAKPDIKPTVLFLCTGNSCRSQMAHGWTNHFFADTITALSAGVDPHGVNPVAIQVMQEVGVDISDHKATHVDTYLGQPIDLVVTVCDHAHEHCPVIPGANMVHHSFEDPPALAKALAAAGATVEEQHNAYRRVRDEIQEFVLTLPTLLPEK